MNNTTWVLGDAEAERRLTGPIDGGWQEQVRQQLRAARYSMSFTAAQVSAAQELARGQMRPLSMGGSFELEQAECPFAQVAEDEQLSFMAEMFKQQLAQLPARQQEALRLRAMGLKQREIAAAMDCSQPAIAALLRKAQGRLAQAEMSSLWLQAIDIDAREQLLHGRVSRRWDKAVRKAEPVIMRAEALRRCPCP